MGLLIKQKYSSRSGLLLQHTYQNKDSDSLSYNDWLSQFFFFPPFPFCFCFCLFIWFGLFIYLFSFSNELVKLRTYDWWKMCGNFMSLDYYILMHPCLTNNCYMSPKWSFYYLLASYQQKSSGETITCHLNISSLSSSTKKLSY